MVDQTRVTDAKIALQRYARELEKCGYNKQCIEDSVIVLALDIVRDIERGMME
jgi:hypothetical protein